MSLWMLNVRIERNLTPTQHREECLPALTSDNASTPDGRRAKKGNSSIRIYFEERTTRIHVGRDSFVHVSCRNRGTESGYGLISSFEPRICSYCNEALCAPLIEKCLPRLVFWKRPQRLRVISHWPRFLAAYRKLSSSPPWGVLDPERSSLGTIERWNLLFVTP